MQYGSNDHPCKSNAESKTSKFDVEIEDNDDTTMTVKDAFVAWSPFILVLCSYF